MHYIGMIGIFFIGIGVFLFVVQTIYAGCHLNRTQFKDYENISNKPLDIRTEDEKKLMKESWARYYFTKVRNIGFKVGVPLLGLALLFDYIIK